LDRIAISGLLEPLGLLVALAVAILDLGTIATDGLLSLVTTTVGGASGNNTGGKASKSS